MSSKSERLAELDAEFDSPENIRTGRMKQGDYSARRAAIVAETEEPASAPQAAPAPAPAAPRKMMKRNISPERRVELQKRFDEMRKAEDARGLSAFVESEAFSELTDDYAVVERNDWIGKYGAPSQGMLFFMVHYAIGMLKGHLAVARAQIANLEGRLGVAVAVDKRIADLEEKLGATTERRLSRHADHLGRLEDRMKKIEGR